MPRFKYRSAGFIHIWMYHKCPGLSCNLIHVLTFGTVFLLEECVRRWWSCLRYNRLPHKYILAPKWHCSFYKEKLLFFDYCFFSPIWYWYLCSPVIVSLLVHLADDSECESLSELDVVLLKAGPIETLKPPLVYDVALNCYAMVSLFS